MARVAENQNEAVCGKLVTVFGGQTLCGTTHHRLEAIGFRYRIEKGLKGNPKAALRYVVTN